MLMTTATSLSRQPTRAWDYKESTCSRSGTLQCTGKVEQAWQVARLTLSVRYRTAGLALRLPELSKASQGLAAAPHHNHATWLSRSTQQPAGDFDLDLCTRSPFLENQPLTWETTLRGHLNWL